MVSCDKGNFGIEGTCPRDASTKVEKEMRTISVWAPPENFPLSFATRVVCVSSTSSDRVDKGHRLLRYEAASLHLGLAGREKLV